MIANSPWVDNYVEMRAGVPDPTVRTYDFFSGPRDYWAIGGSLGLLIDGDLYIHPMEWVDFALGFFLIEDAPGLEPERAGFFSTLAYSFRPSTCRENPKLYAVLAGFAVFGISIQIFMPYLIIYYEKTLGMADGRRGGGTLGVLVPPSKIRGLPGGGRGGYNRDLDAE